MKHDYPWSNPPLRRTIRNEGFSDVLKEQDFINLFKHLRRIEECQTTLSLSEFIKINHPQIYKYLKENNLI